MHWSFDLSEAVFVYVSKRLTDCVRERQSVPNKSCVCLCERETCTESDPASVMAAAAIHCLLLLLLLHIRLRLCGSSVPRHAVQNMHGSAFPPAASYLLHHSSRYFKESATFALGLNYVQFAKLGLKPLGGGKAL